MCGIIGYVGKRNALNVLIDGLKTLEYRGYDSSGVAYFNKNKIIVKKEKGRIEKLEKELNYNISTNVGIAHTRWATCGIPNKINAHPHSNGKITIVHNGIIENYEELKETLQKENYEFVSDTDSEVIAVLLNKFYKQDSDMLTAINKLKKEVIGSYAVAILCEDFPSMLFAIRKDSPLIVASSKDGNFIASDVPAILNYTNKYYVLEEDEIAVLNQDSLQILDKSLNAIEKKVEVFEGDGNASSKGSFKHYMIKEIYEEKSVIKRLLENYNTLKKLTNHFKFLDKYKNIDIIACGSAYNVGVIAKYLIDEYANIPVNVEIASEYRYKNNFLTKDSLAIFISQSGETADTLAALRKVKDKNIDTLGIVNVQGSSIAREADTVIYTKAGPEIAVATTKAYIAQLVVSILISLYLGYKNKTITKKELEKTLNDLSEIDIYLDKILNDSYDDISNIIAKCNNMFFLGRNIDYGIALEGSLKLKEISYIHSEAYAAGELKHGTISLIEKDTPVISIVTNENIFDKTISNIKEVKARGAYNIVISSRKVEVADKSIILPNINKLLLPLFAVIPLQLISYKVANIKGCDIDKPRNLAKSVTVE